MDFTPGRNYRAPNSARQGHDGLFQSKHFEQFLKNSTANFPLRHSHF
jgi:hypothetical protein